MAQVMFSLQVVDPQFSGNGIEHSHVKECMQLFLGHLQRVAQNSFATCKTNGLIHYGHYDQGLGNESNEYYLPVVVDCDCFRVDMLIQYTITISCRDNIFVSFNVILENIIIKKDDPLNKDYYLGPTGIKFERRDTDSHTLYRSSMTQPQTQRNISYDYKIVCQAAWTVLCKMRRLFIINSLDQQNPQIIKFWNYGDLVHRLYSAVDADLSALQKYATPSWPPSPPPY